MVDSQTRHIGKWRCDGGIFHAAAAAILAWKKRRKIRFQELQDLDHQLGLSILMGKQSKINKKAKPNARGVAGTPVPVGG